MTSALLIGLGGLILSALTYFAGVQRTERRHEKGEKESRINHVVDFYVKASQAHMDSGLSGLMKAGIGTLKNDQEIREACQRIINHGEHSPLAAIQKFSSEIDLFIFFQKAKGQGAEFIYSGKYLVLAQELTGKK